MSGQPTDRVETGEEELYDRKTDLFQLTNIPNDPYADPAVKARLAAKLAKLVVAALHEAFGRPIGAGG